MYCAPTLGQHVLIVVWIRSFGGGPSRLFVKRETQTQTQTLTEILGPLTLASEEQTMSAGRLSYWAPNRMTSRPLTRAAFFLILSSGGLFHHATR